MRRAWFRDDEMWRAGRNGPGAGAIILAGSPVARVVIAAAMLFACAGDPAQNPAWQLAGHPGLLFPIKVYYERNALEENGRCTAPLLEGVSRSEVLADDQDQLVVALAYRYRDRIRDEPRAPRGRCRGSGNARGSRAAPSRSPKARRASPWSAWTARKRGGGCRRRPCGSEIADRRLASALGHAGAPVPSSDRAAARQPSRKAASRRRKMRSVR